jgi:hypothetical protein
MLPLTAITSMCSHAVHLPVLVVMSQIVAIMLGTKPVALATTAAVSLVLIAAFRVDCTLSETTKRLLSLSSAPG